MDANDTFASDLENRLDDFFNDDNVTGNKNKETSETADFPLKELKSVVLAIDWEITEDVLNSLIRNIDELLEEFSDDNVNHTLLLLMKALGKYIRSHKSKAHPDTIKRMMSVYSTLEKIVMPNDLSQAEKEQALNDEINQFKILKQKVRGTTAVSKKKAAGRKPVDLDRVVQAMEDIRQTLLDEFQSLRKEIQELKNKS